MEFWVFERRPDQAPVLPNRPLSFRLSFPKHSPARFISYVLSPAASLSSSVPGEECLGTVALRGNTLQYLKQRRSSKDCLGSSVRQGRHIFCEAPARLRLVDFESALNVDFSDSDFSHRGDQPLRFGPYQGHSMAADWTQIGSKSVVPKQNLANGPNSLFTSSFTSPSSTRPSPSEKYFYSSALLI